MTADDSIAGNGAGLEALLEQAEEKLAAAARATPVEAEDELVEVALQVRLVDRTLMRAQQPPP